MLQEDLDIHGVWNVTYIWEVQCRFHIEIKELQNICVCVNLALGVVPSLYGTIYLVDINGTRSWGSI